MHAGKLTQVRVWGTLAVALAGGLAGAGCSSGSDHASPTTTTSTTTIPLTATTRPRAARIADTALARSMLVRVADVPGAWRVVAGAAGAGSDARLEHVCPPIAHERRRIAGAEGGAVPSAATAFVGGAQGLPVIRTKLYVAGDTSVAARVFALVASKRYAGCVGRAFAAQAPGAVRYGVSRVAAVAAPRLGNDSAAYRVSVPSMNGNVTFTTRLDLTVIRRGRVVAVVLFADSDLFPLASAARATVVTKMMRRVTGG